MFDRVVNTSLPLARFKLETHKLVQNIFSSRNIYIYRKSPIDLLMPANIVVQLKLTVLLTWEFNFKPKAVYTIFKLLLGTDKIKDI